MKMMFDVILITIRMIDYLRIRHIGSFHEIDYERNARKSSRVSVPLGEWWRTVNMAMLTNTMCGMEVPNSY